MVYANTHDGSHSFATVIFSIESYQPNLAKPGSFPAYAVIIGTSGVVIFVVVIASFQLYRKHRKNLKSMAYSHDV